MQNEEKEHDMTQAHTSKISHDEEDELRNFVEDEHKKEPDYKKGFNVLMQYWEDLPDDVKEEVDATLKELGL